MTELRIPLRIAEVDESAHVGYFAGTFPQKQFNAKSFTPSAFLSAVPAGALLLPLLSPSRDRGWTVRPLRAVRPPGHTRLMDQFPQLVSDRTHLFSTIVGVRRERLCEKNVVCANPVLV